MEYLLCKKLKDAGFPNYPRRVFYNGKNGECLDADCSIWDEEVDVGIPILSELIEACGEWFGSLEKTETAFFAYSKDYPKQTNERTPIESGKTPEIAVAKLYLELNTN